MSEGARGITAIKDAPAGSWLWPRLFFFFNYDPPLSCGDRGAGDTEGWVFSASDGGGRGLGCPAPPPGAAVLWLAFLMAVVPVSFFFFWIFFFLALRPPKRDLFSFLPVSPLCPF